MIEGLDSGIRQTVEWLRAHDFETTDSGDGVSKPDMECALDCPNVFMVVVPDSMINESLRLLTLLQERGIDPRAPGSEVSVEASFDPANGLAILSLLGVDDAMLFPVAQ